MAASFNGSSDLLNCGSVMTDNDTLTVMAWANSNSSSQQGSVIGNGPSSDFGGYQLMQGASGGSIANGDFWAIHLPGTKYQGQGSAITQGDWYHVAMTRGASTWTMYINGVAQGTTFTDAPGNTPALFAIGAHREFAAWVKQFNGRIADVRAWNVELTAAQIATEMRSPQPQFYLSNLEVWVPMDNSSVPSSYPDHSGNGNSGAVVGSPSVYQHVPY